MFFFGGDGIGAVSEAENPKNGEEDSGGRRGNQVGGCKNGHLKVSAMIVMWLCLYHHPDDHKSF